MACYKLSCRGTYNIIVGLLNHPAPHEHVALRPLDNGMCERPCLFTRESPTKMMRTLATVLLLAKPRMTLLTVRLIMGNNALVAVASVA